MKNIIILGATGSIGTQTLDIVRRLPHRFKVAGMSAFSNVAQLHQYAEEFQVSEENLAYGPNADLARLAKIPEADMVVVAVNGAVGIHATAAALDQGKDVALATKEVLVAAGDPITKKAKSAGAHILPIDSEHSAIFQCLKGNKHQEVKRLLLTASGGPFREWTKEQISKATVEDALAHPTWSMGKKITIDSATMMNKGLEMIEAHWLFDMPMDKIDVVIHPQSIVHSLVEYVDCSLLAQMSKPDMRLPILYALSYPDRIDAALPGTDLTQLNAPLTFAEPDEDRFPSLRLAREAANAGGVAPAVLNAANEMAVALFLEKRINFTTIPEIVEHCLENHRKINNPSLDAIIVADNEARESARNYAEEITSSSKGINYGPVW